MTHALNIQALREFSQYRPEGYFEDVMQSGTVIGNDVVLSDETFLLLREKYSQHETSVEGRSDANTASLAAGTGPGTELSKLLKRFGIEPTPTCQCRAKAAEMDAWGPDECARPERVEEVLAVMREEAKARGLPFLDAAGRLLIRRAIANARRAASG